MKRILWSIILTLFLVFPAFAHNDIYRWPVLRVVDGDTIAVIVPNLPPELWEVKIRVKNIDTPETRRGRGGAKCDKEIELGNAATEFVVDLIEQSDSITFTNVEWGKWGGRVAADVYIDGKLLSNILLDNGYAQPYDGTGSKPSWCD